MANGSRLRAVGVLLRNLIVAALLYSCIYVTINFATSPSSRAQVKKHVPNFLAGHGTVKPDDVKQTPNGHVNVNLPGSSKTVTINPHANVFNRPPSADIPKDDFYGPRPHPDTEADLNLLVEAVSYTHLTLPTKRIV